MNEHPNYGLTNAELIKYLELPEDIIERLQTEQGSEFTATANQFLSAIVNKIVYQRIDAGSFTNPFAKKKPSVKALYATINSSRQLRG